MKMLYPLFGLLGICIGLLLVAITLNALANKHVVVNGDRYNFTSDWWAGSFIENIEVQTDTPTEGQTRLFFTIAVNYGTYQYGAYIDLNQSGKVVNTRAIYDLTSLECNHLYVLHFEGTPRYNGFFIVK